MMPDVALPKKMKRCREEKRHQHARKFVRSPVRKEHRMFGFVDDRIDGVHQDAEGDCERENCPPMMRMRSRPEASAQANQLRENDPCVQKAWNAMRRRGFGSYHRRSPALNEQFVPTTL